MKNLYCKHFRLTAILFCLLYISPVLCASIQTQSEIPPPQRLRQVASSLPFPRNIFDPEFWELTIKEIADHNPDDLWILASGHGLQKVYTLPSRNTPTFPGKKPVSFQVAYNDPKTLAHVTLHLWTQGDSKDISFQEAFKEVSEFIDFCHQTGHQAQFFQKQLSSKISFKGRKIQFEHSLWEFLIEPSYFIHLRISPLSGSYPVKLPANPGLKGSPAHLARSDQKLELRRNLLEFVEHRDNGELYIKHIPMINQGDKGYCVPATCARILQFYGMDTNEYELARIMETSAETGTHMAEIKQNLKRLSSGLPVFTKQLMFVPGRIFNYLEKGIPLVWIIPGHCRLIFGINKKEKYILYSDSWGINGLEERMSFDKADKITLLLFALK